MNEHARSIFKATMDGRTVQFRYGLNGWHDADPFREGWSPLFHSDLWRIKPDKTRLYRVYLCGLVKTGTTETANADNLKEAKSIEESVEDGRCFRRWLTNWIPYEVEEE